MKKILNILLIVVFISLIACKEDKKTINQNNDNKTDTFQNIIPEILKVKDKLFNVPSPIQASMLIQKNKIPFNPELLNKPNNYTKYLTTFKQALNLGVYGSNMATLFVYDQLSMSAQYLSVVKKLSEQLGIFNSINSELFERIERNSQKKDSLIFLISDIYKEIDSYLTENDQQEIGILILIGGWVESIYLLTQLSYTTQNPELKERVAQQTIPLRNIIELYQPYSTKSKQCDTLYKSLELLGIEFSKIQENYIYQPPQTFPDKKLTIINSTTTYTVQDENLKNIRQQIEKLRNWIIK